MACEHYLSGLAYKVADKFSRKHETMTKLEVFGGDNDEQEYLKRIVTMITNYPHFLTSITIRCDLTTKMGIQIAGYLARSTTLTELDLSDNKLGIEAYFAISVSLKINTSLVVLDLSENAITEDDKLKIDSFFIAALKINSRDPASRWYLYDSDDEDYQRLLKLTK